MAALGNELVYVEGVALAPSSSDSINRLQQTSSLVGTINHTGNPEGVVSANPSSVSHDPVSGNVYFKQSGTGNTGWILLASFKWNVVTDADNPVSLASSNGYISKGASVVGFVLPASASIGDSFVIAGYGNLWTLGQNANQSITLGVNTTTVGIAGGIAATQVRDSVEIVCVTTDIEFQIINGIGNLTFI